MEIVLRMKPLPVLAAAVVLAISPSGCAMRCMAVGAMHTGVATRWPSSVVEMSMLETSRSTRGRSVKRLNASRFSRSVHMSSAPDA